MRTFPLRALAALILALGAGASAQAAAPADAAASQPANTVRPEFGKPYNAASELVRQKQNADALTKLKEAEAVGNLTPYESFLVLRLRSVIEYSMNDLPAAERDFEAVLASDKLADTDRPALTMGLADIYFRDQKYPQAATWLKRYLDAGGSDPRVHDMYGQALYLSKDYAGASKVLQTSIDASYAAGKTPDERLLRMLANAQSEAKDDDAYAKTVERLAVAYPNGAHAHDYWLDVVQRANEGPKMTDRQYLDYMRLRTAAFGQTADSERLTYGLLAMKAGFPAEAKRVLDDGLSRKAIPAADTAQATQVRDQAARAAAQDKAQAAANETAAKAAKDGSSLVSLGLLLAFDGDAARGTDLIQQGIAKGGLKAPDEAQLHLGMAQFLAGRYADAGKTFDGVTTQGPIGAMAHVWSLLARARQQAAAAPAAAASTAG